MGRVGHLICHFISCPVSLPHFLFPSHHYLYISWCTYNLKNGRCSYYLTNLSMFRIIWVVISRGQLKCDGTCAETRLRLSAKRTSPFKLVGAPVRSTTGSLGTRISSSNAGYTMSQGSVKGTGYPLHSPVSPSLPLPCITVCHHISTRLYLDWHSLEEVGMCITVCFHISM